MHSIQCSVPFSPFTTNIFPSMFTTTYSKRNGAYERKSLPKKSGGILCEGNRLEAYRFIKQHHNEFGLRWLLHRFNICPNAYYNYRKHRKADHYARREEGQVLQKKAMWMEMEGKEGTVSSDRNRTGIRTTTRV